MNLDDIRALIETFDQSSLTELRYEHDDLHLTLKRTKESNPVYTQPVMVHPHAVPQAPIVVESPHAQAPPSEPLPQEPSPDAAGVEVITSPIVGTVYRAPSPDSPAFCQEGDIVEKGETICILEAMKVMNELEAEFRMEIVTFRVNNGDMAEYGTPLVEVRRV